MRKLVSILLLMSISTGGFSLGLGNIELSSGLNQTFDARIELLSPTSSELDSLNIRVADIEAFDRAGIEWLLILNTLSFEVECCAGFCERRIFWSENLKPLSEIKFILASVLFNKVNVELMSF